MAKKELKENEKQEDSKQEDEKSDKKEEIKKAYFIQRLVAFILDVMLVTIVASLISIPFVDNTNSEKLSKEANEIIEKFVQNDIGANEYVEQYTSITYKIAKNTGMISLITIVLNILYFVVFQIYNKGQTLGKKLMKIRVVSDNGELTMDQMILRSFIANFILVDLLGFIIMLFGSREIYFYGVGILQGIQYLIVIISVFMIIGREDGCSVHDMLVHTKVLRD